MSSDIDADALPSSSAPASGESGAATLTADPAAPPASTEPASGTKTKGGVSRTRNIVSGTILAIVGVIAAFEVTAALRFKLAFDRLNAAMEAVETTTMPTSQMVHPDLEKVNEMVGREPDAPLVESDEWRLATYTWRGVLRPYVIYARFHNGSTLQLHDISSAQDEFQQ